MFSHSKDMLHIPIAHSEGMLHIPIALLCDAFTVVCAFFVFSVVRVSISTSSPVATGEARKRERQREKARASKRARARARARKREKNFRGQKRGGKKESGRERTFETFDFLASWVVEHVHPRICILFCKERLLLKALYNSSLRPHILVACLARNAYQKHMHRIFMALSTKKTNKNKKQMLFFKFCRFFLKKRKKHLAMPGPRGRLHDFSQVSKVSSKVK